jgi:hypothetical protein
MSFKYVIGRCVCDDCGRAERGMVETYWASGSRHYCTNCWPARRAYYEDDEGRCAWKRVGNSYLPVE